MSEQSADCLCELCGQKASLTFHHLIPRRCHSNKWFRKQFSREEMQAGISICRPCHKLIHHHFGHKELGRYYNTKAKLLQTQPIRNYVRWARQHVSES